MINLTVGQYIDRGMDKHIFILRLGLLYVGSRGDTLHILQFIWPLRQYFLSRNYKSIMLIQYHFPMLILRPRFWIHNEIIQLIVPSPASPIGDTDRINVFNVELAFLRPLSLRACAIK